MALSESGLTSDLLAFFSDMKQNPMSEEDCATRLAKLLVKHIKTAAIPVGSVIVGVTGQASGTPNPAEIKVT